MEGPRGAAAYPGRGYDLVTPQCRAALWPCSRPGAATARRAHCSDASRIAGLVNQGLATLTSSKVRAGGKVIEVAKARITEAGRDALAEG
jgi:hypothetical protein